MVAWLMGIVIGWLDVKISRRWGDCMSGCLDMYFVPWVGGCHVNVTWVGVMWVSHGSPGWLSGKHLHMVGRVVGSHEPGVTGRRRQEPLRCPGRVTGVQGDRW